LFNVRMGHEFHLAASIANSIASIDPVPPASCTNSAPYGWMIGDIA